MKRDIFLCLEPKGTILEVIRAAKRRGYYVVAAIADPSLLEGTGLPYSSALSCIDETISIRSWRDPQVTEDIIQVLGKLGEVRGIYAGVDPCAQVLAQLRVKFGLPTSTSTNLAKILDKHQLRKTLLNLGLSKLRTWHSSVANDWKTWVPGGTVYFKPIHGFFSAYVERCANLPEFQAAKMKWEQRRGSDSKFIADYLGESDAYHVEEAIDGELMSVEAISTQGEFRPLGVLSRILYSKNPVVEMGSCFPYPHPRALEIIEQVRKAHLALGITDGPTHTELIVGTNGNIEIIDLNPRFVGADVLQSINHAYGIQIEETLLDWACGKAIHIEPKKRKYSCLQYILPPHAMDFQSIEFPKSTEVKFFTQFMKTGSKILSSERQLDYLGCYLTVMEEFNQAVKSSHDLRVDVKINHSIEGAY